MRNLAQTPVMLFHPGKQHSPQTALALQDIGRLKAYATSIFYDSKKFPYYLENFPGPLGRRLHFEFSRFEHPEIDPTLVRTWGTFEWLERLALRLGASKLSYLLDRIGNESFARGLTQDIMSSSDFALWGYNGSALNAFRIAKRQGRICVLDRTIGDYRYHNRVMREQEEKYPQFFNDEERMVDDQRIQLDDEEYELADKIVVGSNFCKKTIVESSPVNGIDSKISVIPYCVNSNDFEISKPIYTNVDSGPVKFLFVGRIVPRKGIHLILEAISRFEKSSATLTLLGKMLIPEAAFEPFSQRVAHIPSVAPNEVARIMGEHHVLLFPSFFEGSAITLLEALSCGMGIIQSQQAGCGANDATGIILPANTVDNLYAAMKLAVDNRDLIDTWRSNARCEALRYSFTAYRDNVSALISEI